jgi:hypothetical protein
LIRIIHEPKSKNNTDIVRDRDYTVDIRNIGLKQIKEIDLIEKPSLLFDKDFLNKFVKDSEFSYAYTIVDDLKKRRIINRYEYVILKKMIILAKIHYNSVKKM